MRRSIAIALAMEEVEQGWPAFRFVESALRGHGLTVDQIEWRWYGEIGPLDIGRAVFEVLPGAPPPPAVWVP